MECVNRMQGAWRDEEARATLLQNGKWVVIGCFVTNLILGIISYFLYREMKEAETQEELEKNTSYLGWVFLIDIGITILSIILFGVLLWNICAHW